jgi:protein-disulfide isomerase
MTKLFLPLTRRAALSLGAAGAGLAVSGLEAWAQKRPAAPDEIAIDELMKPGALPDLVLGKADAPCTIVEYASMTCGHCANFHNKVFPILKDKYITPGTVRFILREFPLDNLAAAASMLARCVGGDKTYPLVDALFTKQEEWAFVRSNPVPELFKFARQAGFTQEGFDKCLTDQKLLDDLMKGREIASTKFGVQATPTFFINGKRLKDAPSVENFEKAIAAVVKS